jgi:hypothetical protein
VLFFWGFIMRRFVLPNLVELSILATLAVLTATIVGAFAQPQVAIVAAGFPMVLIAMFMGARRTGQLDSTTASPIVTAVPEAEQSA